jgi:hypothetical protein
MIFALWERNRAQQRSRPLARAVLDPQLWMAAAGAVVLFALVHNVVFNPSGFMAHVRDITTSRQGYRMVESTLAGRLELLRLTLDLSLRSWGWPLWIVTMAGVVVAFKETESRRVAGCLALVIASYYVGFINVILYNTGFCCLSASCSRFSAVWRSIVFSGHRHDRFSRSAWPSSPARSPTPCCTR